MLRRIAVLLGVILFVVLLWRLGPGDVLVTAGRVGWWSVLVLLLYAGHDVTRALALRACVLRPGLLRFGDALAIRLSGDAVEALTFTGPLLAEPTRAWLLERRGLTLTEGFAATVTEYLICSFVGAAMSIGALVYLVTALHPAGPVARVMVGAAWGLGAFLTAGGVAIVRRFYLIGSVLAWLSNAGLLRGRLKPDIAAVNRMEELLLATLHDQPARFLRVALYETVSQAFLVTELLVLMRAVAQGVSTADALVVEGAIKIVGIVFLFVPLQIGVAESAYAALFPLMALPAAAGFAVVLLRRARSLVAAAIGLFTLSRLSRERQQV